MHLNYLNEKEWQKCVEAMPIVAIDLILIRNQKDILMGERVNEPAKGSLFVPGGRILKNETIDNAFERISQVELGTKIKKDKSKFFGVYEHFYTNSIWPKKNINTHYIVIGFLIEIIDSLELKLNLNKQHKSSKWVNIHETNKLNIHKYSKT